MKRFANPRYVRYQLHRLFVTALLAVAALALIGKAAHAQCGNFVAVPGDVFSIFSDRLEPFAPIGDTAICTKIVKAALAACHAAVSDVASCSEGVATSSYKATKAACASSPDPKACAAIAKNQLDIDKAGIEDAAAPAHADCEANVENLATHCLEGFPT